MGAHDRCGTRRAVRRDRPTERAEHVVLRVRVADAREQLRMRRDDVEGLHERLLGDLPVAAQDLRDVRLLEPPFERPPFEVRVEVADVIRRTDGSRGRS